VLLRHRRAVLRQRRPRSKTFTAESHRFEKTTNVVYWSCPDGFTILRGDEVKDLFLCHAEADKAWVEKLGGRLEAERISNRNIEVFLDSWDVDHGENLVSKIEAALAEARFCGVVLSPAMLNRDWPRAEWTAVFVGDPAGRRRQILPILLHDRDPITGEPCEIPMLLRPLRRFNFTQESNFEAEFEELVRKLRGERPRRGGGRTDAQVRPGLPAPGAEAADAVSETLVSNLLPVQELPERIWSDVATTSKKTDVWSSLQGVRVPPFTISEGRLYSFFPSDNSENPFRRFLSGVDPRAEPVSNWFTNADRSRILVSLFNEALQEHAFHLRIRNLKDNRKQYFCPIYDGKPRLFRWGTGGRARTIAKLAERPDKTKFGIHYSAKMRFLVLGSRVFLLIEPGWMFTADGITPLQGKQVTVLSTKFGGKERNAAVLRNLMMWSMLLANGSDHIPISLGGTKLTVDQKPAMASVQVGIDGDTLNVDRILSEEIGGEVTSQESTDAEIDEVLSMATAGTLESADDSEVETSE
jgi:TIR domain